MFNTKALLVLALVALSSLVDARSVRRNLKDKQQQVAPPQSLSVTRHKGVSATADGLRAAPDEVDVNTVIFTCEKGDEACKDLEDAGEKVSQEEFGKSLAEDMMGMLEGDGEKKKNEDDRRELYTCYWYYYCDCCYCYYRYACY